MHIYINTNPPSLKQAEPLCARRQHFPPGPFPNSPDMYVYIYIFIYMSICRYIYSYFYMYISMCIYAKPRIPKQAESPCAGRDPFSPGPSWDSPRPPLAG